MIRKYHCETCNKLLFRGSLELLLGKKHSNEAFIEPKCDRCGKINYFSYDPSSELRTSEPDQSSLLDSLS